MRVLGIDPGSNITGYGIVEKEGSSLRHIENGAYQVRKNGSFADRLLQIYEKLAEVIQEFRPEIVAVERVFVSKNAASALKLGESRGVAILAASQSALPVHEYTTREVKQAMTGYGQASKGQIQKMVQQILRLPEVASEDASDALAVALCHLQSARLKGIYS